VPPFDQPLAFSHVCVPADRILGTGRYLVNVNKGQNCLTIWDIFDELITTKASTGGSGGGDDDKTGTIAAAPTTTAASARTTHYHNISFSRRPLQTSPPCPVLIKDHCILRVIDDDTIALIKPAAIIQHGPSTSGSDVAGGILGAILVVGLIGAAIVVDSNGSGASFDAVGALGSSSGGSSADGTQWRGCDIIYRYSISKNRWYVFCFFVFFFFFLVLACSLVIVPPCHSYRYNDALPKEPEGLKKKKSRGPERDDVGKLD
jgi:hypothetical protein